MGIATGETYSFAEGRLYLYASASGAASGSGIAFAEGATLREAYGWREMAGANRRRLRVLTGRRVDLTVDTLYSDRTLAALAQGTAAVHAKFEGLVTGAGVGKSAVWWLYSGVIDEVQLRQADNQVWRGSYGMHAHDWSAFG